MTSRNDLKVNETSLNESAWFSIKMEMENGKEEKLLKMEKLKIKIMRKTKMCKNMDMMVRKKKKKKNIMKKMI